MVRPQYLSDIRMAVLIEVARDDCGWYLVDPGLHLLRGQDPIKAGLSDEVAQ